MRKAVVHNVSGKVVNIIEVTEGSGFGMADHTLMDAGSAEIGGTWTGTAFSPAPLPVVDPLSALYKRCRDYVASSAPGDTADRLDAYLANASPTAAETVATVKETVRTLRALIRIVRGLS